MLNKFMKRGTRKVPKSDAIDPSSTSTISVINHASRPYNLPPPNNSNVNSSSHPQNSTTVESLPLFRDVAASERHALFLRKLSLCSILFDLSDTLKSLREKEAKRQTLLELVDFVHSSGSSSSPRGLPDHLQEELIRTISTNIFRCLPPASHENTGSESGADPEEEDPYLDPAWPHLQIVYELLLRYIVSSETDTKIAKRYIDHSFVLRLLDLFNSEDPREREYLKTILHRIYGKFMVHRPFIRKAINNIFYRFIFETERHSGIGELLEILGSIINGFALPMKEEHKLFLVRALIPLHKPKSLGVYHQQLSYCITQFVEKDYKLADTVIRGLLKYWPVTNCQKEVLFLGEVEDVLEATQSKEFQKCMAPLFKRIGRCLNSSHFQEVRPGSTDGTISYLFLLLADTLQKACCNRILQGALFLRHCNYSFTRLSIFAKGGGVPNEWQVAERALFLWNNDHIVGLIAQNRHVIFPIIFESLERNMQSHWNQAVHGLTANVRKMFLEMDSELFEECQRQYIEKEAKAKAFEEQREMAWRRLEAVVEAKSVNDDMVLVT